VAVAPAAYDALVAAPLTAGPLAPRRRANRRRPAARADAGLTVRAATVADAPHIASLLGELGYELSSAQARGGLARILRDRSHQALVATVARVPVGFINVRYRFQLHHAGVVGTIDELVVARRHRSAGVGARLVGEALAAARKRGAVLLDVGCNLRRKQAHAFYERCGFERTSLRFVRSL
jgi:GNAT superfamily N-acetyltransferase